MVKARHQHRRSFVWVIVVVAGFGKRCAEREQVGDEIEATKRSTTDATQFLRHRRPTIGQNQKSLRRHGFKQHHPRRTHDAGV